MQDNRATYVIYVIGGVGGDYFEEFTTYNHRVGLFKKERRTYVSCTDYESSVKVFLTKTAAQAVVDKILEEYPEITSAEVMHYVDAKLK